MKRPVTRIPRPASRVQCPCDQRPMISVQGSASSADRHGTAQHEPQGCYLRPACPSLGALSGTLHRNFAGERTTGRRRPGVDVNKRYTGDITSCIAAHRENWLNAWSRLRRCVARDLSAMISRRRCCTECGTALACALTHARSYARRQSSEALTNVAHRMSGVGERRKTSARREYFAFDPQPTSGGSRKYHRWFKSRK